MNLKNEVNDEATTVRRRREPIVVLLQGNKCKSEEWSSLVSMHDPERGYPQDEDRIETKQWLAFEA